MPAMMTAKKGAPPLAAAKVLHPYQFHGVNVEYRDGRDEAVGDCPFCGRDGKFSINVETGQWRCFVCNEGANNGPGNGKVYAGGNVYTFLRKVWEYSRNRKDVDYAPLAANRKVRAETLVAWGVVRSVLTNDWLVPGHSPDGKLNQLYKYVRDSSSGKYKLLATAELAHCLFGAGRFDKGKKDVLVCEGPWDAMALEEVLKITRSGEDGGFRFTGNEEGSLWATTNVVAVPGCGTFNQTWTGLFAYKNVTLLYDNDHPREHPVTHLMIPPAGPEGMKRVAVALLKAEEPPEQVFYLRWGKDGYDPDLPAGTDVRDMVTRSDNLGARVNGFRQLMDRVETVPPEWVPGRTAEAAQNGKAEMDCRPCTSWQELAVAWRKAMQWTSGLDTALSVMLACVASTKALGDQLWFKIIGPPACGKSTLCEALSVNKKYVLAKSTIRGFHSGFRSDAEGKEDNSLISQLYDKTLVTKDGDTLLQSPNLPQILSEARDIYDTTARTHYRNKMSRSYEGVRMTWVLCGTSSLRELDSSELGARFLDCVIMDAIDDKLEDEILWRVANRVDRSMALEANGKFETQHDPDMLLAMQLTGGYVGYLRANAQELLAKVEFPQDLLRKCIAYGKFVAYMRARPSKKQEETVEREFATRLTSQLVRLAKCLSVVLNKTKVDDEVMRRVAKVATDTARGRTLEITKYLHKHGESGVEVQVLSLYTGETEEKLRVLLRFMKKIGATENFVKSAEGVKIRPRWRLTDKMTAIFDGVMGDAANPPE